MRVRSSYAAFALIAAAATTANAAPRISPISERAM